MMSQRSLLRIILLAVLMLLLYLGVRGYFHPSSSPRIETDRDLRLVESYLESYPSIVFFLHYRSLTDLIAFARPFVPRLQHLSFIEKMMIQRFGGPGWLVARETAGHFPYWTWMAFIPAGSEVSALFSMSGPLLPGAIQIRSTDALSGCQKGYIISGFEHPWGRSLEIQLCGGYMVIGPELYSWVDMLQSFVKTTEQLKASPPASSSNPSLFTLWIDLHRIPSEALSPLFKGQTARISTLLRKYATVDGLYRIRAWPEPSRYRWEITGPWPPIQVQKQNRGLSPP